MKRGILIALAVALALYGAGAEGAAAQVDRRTSVELRGTAMTPTFDIGDTADLGFGGGIGLGYRVSDDVRLMLDFDLGMHGTDTPGFDINTFHYMGKIGYDVLQNERFVLTVNLGAGAVTFGGDLPRDETYFAINAGASSVYGCRRPSSSSSVLRATSRSRTRRTWAPTTPGCGRWPSASV